MATAAASSRMSTGTALSLRSLPRKQLRTSFIKDSELLTSASSSAYQASCRDRFLTGSRKVHVASFVRDRRVFGAETDEDADDEDMSDDGADEAIELDLKVTGMTCDGCSSRVEAAVKGMSGVQSVDVNLETGIVTIQVEAEDQLDAAFNKLPKLVECVQGLGFEAEPHFG